MDIMKDFKNSCASCGPTVPCSNEYLFGCNNSQWLPYDFHIIVEMVLGPFKLLQGKCGLQMNPIKTFYSWVWGVILETSHRK